MSASPAGVLVTDLLVIDTVRDLMPDPNQTIMFPVNSDGKLLGLPGLINNLDVWALPGDLSYIIARLSVSGDIIIRSIRATARRIR